jgi:hypothetical protein
MSVYTPQQQNYGHQLGQQQPYGQLDVAASGASAGAPCSR